MAVTINAIGRLAKYFYYNREVHMKIHLSRLREIDWLRSNDTDWLNRTIREDGKVMNNEIAILLTCSRIKSLIGITLSKEEISKENSIG